jgi:hypothetical protein
MAAESAAKAVVETKRLRERVRFESSVITVPPTG